MPRATTAGQQKATKPPEAQTNEVSSITNLVRTLRDVDAVGVVFRLLSENP
jgi:hypothetical protein